MNAARTLALRAIAAIVAVASAVSFAESYRGLFEWAHRHGLQGVWAYAWPLQVDVFIAVGELALFAGLAGRWPTRARAGAWFVTLAGLAVSVAGNVGHVTGHAASNRVTAAVPPLAAAAALAVGLGVLKRVVAASNAAPAVPAGAPAGFAAVPAGSNGHDGAASLFAAELAAGSVPSIRRIRGQMHCGQPRARQIQAHLETLTPAGQSIRELRDEMRQGGAS